MIFLREIVRLQQNRAHLLMRYTLQWKPIHVRNPGPMVSVCVNQPDTNDFSSYANALMQRLIANRNLQERDSQSVSAVCSAIISSENADDPDRHIDELIGKLNAAGCGEIGNEIVRAMVRKYSCPIQPIASVSDVEIRQQIIDPAPEPVQVAAPNLADIAVAEPPLQRPCKERRYTHPDKDLLKTLKDTQSKLPVMERIYDSIKADRIPIKRLESGLRKLWYTSINPIVTCLRVHCAGDHTEFARRWGNSLASFELGQFEMPKGRNRSRRVRIF